MIDEMMSVTEVPQRFVTAATIVRHLLTDPVLPVELLPAGWPGDTLRTAYKDFAAELSSRRDTDRLMEAK